MSSKFKKLLEKHWVSHLFAACIAVVLYWLLTHLFFISTIMEFLSPVIWGVFIAYLINPLANYLEMHLFFRVKKEKSKHYISVIVSLIIVAILIALLFIAFVPPLVNSVTGIINNMNVYGDNLRKYINNISSFAGRMHIDMSNITSSADELVNAIVTSVTENAASILESFFNVGTSIVNIVIGVVLAIYFLFDKEKQVSGINRIRRLYLSDEKYERNNKFWEKCHTILTRFLVFDIIDGFIIGIINMVFMLIFKMPYVALISVIVGITNLIPTLGPIIGAIIGGILLALTNPISALLFIIFTIALQTFDASILKPRLFGGSFGVSAVWILIAIVVGGKISGMIGVLFAIPVAAIFTYALNDIIFPIWENKKKTSSQDFDKEKSE